MYDAAELAERAEEMEHDLPTSGDWTHVGVDGRRLRVSVNVTPMRQAEASLKNFAFLIENASDFIGISDLQFRPIYLNAAAARISGMNASTIGRVSFFDFFYRDDRSIVA